QHAPILERNQFSFGTRLTWRESCEVSNSISTIRERTRHYTVTRLQKGAAVWSPIRPRCATLLGKSIAVAFSNSRSPRKYEFATDNIALGVTDMRKGWTGWPCLSRRY
ncbi:MAG: hypothetical protein O6950_00635, partial [Gammaproteobacteria bacterium]|nr:hypothetical protein [Gammaproteobacteria bacterium]